MIKRNFNPIRVFMEKTVEEVFIQMLSNSKYLSPQFKIRIFENQNGKFTFVPFSNDLQVAPISFVKSNFDSDKKNLFLQQEIILVYPLSQ
jgi:hypothetical protein